MKTWKNPITFTFFGWLYLKMTD